MSKAKLKNLIKFIFQNYNNSNLTETKLQKLLYFCDFGAYQRFNESITNSEYRKNKYGPTLMDLPNILNEMENEGAIKVLKGQNYYGTPQTTFSLLQGDPNLENNFSESELLIIREINEAYRDLTPREISSISHADFPYLATENMGETIKYEYSWLRDEPIETTEEDTEAINFFTSNKFSSLMKKLDQKLN